jgi:hypothetical protein
MLLPGRPRARREPGRPETPASSGKPAAAARREQAHATEDDLRRSGRGVTASREETDEPPD